LTHSDSVQGAQPILPAIEVIAAQRDEHPFRCSRVIRTIRSRTSGENLFIVLLASSSQDSGPPAIPGVGHSLYEADVFKSKISSIP
jgi:hypothetical protein